jgi:CIC family chloride channel protein
MTFAQFREVFRRGQQHYFPVVNKEKRLTGIFSVNDIRSVIFDQTIGELVCMKDVANPDIIYTTPSEDLNEVLKKFTIRNLHRLPVVKDEDHSILLGMLDRKEVIEKYNRRVEEAKSGQPKDDIREERGEVIQLKNKQVKEAMSRNIEVIPEDMNLEELKEFVYKRKFNSFPVVDAQGRLSGILSFSDCQAALKKGDMSVTARDIATHSVVTVTDEETYLSALNKISGPDFAILPVVDRNDPEKLLGVISRRDILSAFSSIIVQD